jgi:hypothetical protein
VAKDLTSKLQDLEMSRLTEEPEDAKPQGKRDLIPKGFGMRIERFEFVEGPSEAAT